MLRGLGVAAVALCILVPSAVSAKPSPTRADRRLDEALARLVKMPGGPPGAIAVIQRGPRRKVFKHGFARTSPRRPVALAQYWRIASVSKAFSGAVALSLVSRGRLRLDDTIAKRLPDLPPAWGSVTLAQLFQHTSGLREFVTSKGAAEYLKDHPRESVSPQTILSWVQDTALQFTPGSKYHYSNTDNIVAALMVEAATGKSYAAALRQYVSKPLALSRTSMPRGVVMPSPFVHGYQGKEDVSQALNPNFSWASGGIVSVPLDLNRFVRGYVGGKLFRGATRAAQLTFRQGQSEPAGPGQNDAGLAIFRYRSGCGTVYGHTGNLPGYTALIAASGDGRRSVVVQVNVGLNRGSGDRKALQALREVFSLGVCAALA
jgi:D-alanyl-D-alanine carboxypeptidase